MDYFNPPRAPPPQSAVDGLSPEAPLAEDDISMWDFMQDPSIFDFPSLNLPPGIDTALDASLLSAGYLQYPYNQFNAASSESTSPSVSPYDLGVPLDDFRQPMPAGFPSDPQNPFFGNLEVPGAGYNGIINWQPQYPIQSPYSLTEDLSPQQLAVPDSTPFQDLLNSPQDPALASLLEDMESLLSSAPEVKVQPFPSQLQWDAAQFPGSEFSTPPSSGSSGPLAYPSPLLQPPTPVSLAACSPPPEQSGASTHHLPETTPSPSRSTSLDIVFETPTVVSTIHTATKRTAATVNPTLEAPVTCKSCNKRIATLLTFNTTTADFLYSNLTLDVTCGACRTRERGGAERSLKRGPHPDFPCHLCTRIIGCGGMVLKERVVRGTGSTPDGAKDPEVDRLSFDAHGYLKPGSSTPLEQICSACFQDFQLCTACGGGGRFRSGKWRPKSMFESRRSCTLSHVRFKKDAEFTAYDLAAGEHMEDDNTMLAIAQVFHDFWRSQLMTPKVLSGKVEAGMVLIEKVLAEWWTGILRALDVRKNPLPPGHRRYLSIAWRMEAKRTGLTASQKAANAIGSQRGMLSRGWLIQGYHIMDWVPEHRLVHLASTCFWKLAYDAPMHVIEAVVITLYRILLICAIEASNPTQPPELDEDGNPKPRLKCMETYPTHLWRAVRPTFHPQGERLCRQIGWISRQELRKYPPDPFFVKQMDITAHSTSPFLALQANATRLLTLDMARQPTHPPHMASPPPPPPVIDEIPIVPMTTIHRRIGVADPEPRRLFLFEQMRSGWWRASMSQDGLEAKHGAVPCGDEGRVFVPYRGEDGKGQPYPEDFVWAGN